MCWQQTKASSEQKLSEILSLDVKSQDPLVLWMLHVFIIDFYDIQRKGGAFSVPVITGRLSYLL